jgi:predicted AAA+ superfamily ATPase
MFKRWININTDKSCLILGPRRCGKTTLLKSKFPDYKYITLDDLDALNFAKSDPKGFIKSLGTRAVIDEIQRYPELTIAVKYAIDNENAHFLMTGSSSIGLLDSAADTLAGRINLYSLPTACWGENKGFHTHDIFHDQIPFDVLAKANRKIQKALSYGQFPEILTTEEHQDKSDLLTNYKNTYFTRDLMQLSNIENIEGLYAIFNNLIRSTGSHLEISNFAREAGISYPTTKKYLNTLLQSQLIFKLYGYQYGPAKRYIKAAKSYFSDTGIINSFNTNISDGQMFESFVLAELEKRRKLGLIKTDQFYYYKTKAGREIDLIFESEKQLYAIEIKTTQNPSMRDIKNLVEFEKQLNQPIKKFLIYKGTQYQNINHVNLLPVACLYRGR